MRFEIVWQVEDKEWQKALAASLEHEPHSEYDLTSTPLYDLLYGPLQLRYGTDQLFPKWENSSMDGIQVSLLDFAVTLRQILQNIDFNTTPITTLAELPLRDRPIVFKLFRQEDVVEVGADERHAQPLHVPPQAFIEGANAFLDELIQQIEAKAPRILAWQSVKPLALH